jgi:5-methylcytosine-specific restriction endonuclease McrA
MTPEDSHRLDALYTRLRGLNDSGRGAGRNTYKDGIDSIRAVRREVDAIHDKYRALPKKQSVEKLPSLDEACDKINFFLGVRPKQPRTALPQRQYIELKKYILERDKWCLFCGTTSRLTPAHFKRRSQGGHDAPNNLFCACQSCHDKFDQGGKNMPPEIDEKLPGIIEMLNNEPDTWEGK